MAPITYKNTGSDLTATYRFRILCRILRLQTLTKFLNSLSLLLLCGSCGLAVAQQKAHQLSVGFIDVSTFQMSDDREGQVHLAPHVVVRFQRRGAGSALMLTSETGSGMAVLESGEYCASAFGVDGKVLLLATGPHAPRSLCFRIEGGKRSELSLTIGAPQRYPTAIPSPQIE